MHNEINANTHQSVDLILFICHMIFLPNYCKQWSSISCIILKNFDLFRKKYRFHNLGKHTELNSDRLLQHLTERWEKGVACIAHCQCLL